jgi:hypothetical protein
LRITPLDDLENKQDAVEPLPAQLAILAVNAAKRPARRPLPAELPGEAETTSGFRGVRFRDPQHTTQAVQLSPKKSCADRII